MTGPRDWPFKNPCDAAAAAEHHGKVSKLNRAPQGSESQKSPALNKERKRIEK